MTKIQGAGPLYNDSGVYEARKRQSLRARYVYGFIFFATNLLAWFIRDYGAKVLHGLHNIPVCGAGDSKCFHSGGVLRVSLGCFIFFWLMFATTFGTRKLDEVRNSWHSGCWALKFLVIFLILQLISMLHLISWCNNRWMPHPGSNQCGLFGLLLSTVSFIASFAGIAVLYALYVPKSSCVFNIFTIIFTAILVKIMMAVSLHSKVNEGLLSSGIMGSYVVFLCWSALHSQPQTEKCHSEMKIWKDGNWATIVSFIIAICSIAMATFSTGIDTRSFQFRNDEVQLEEDVPYSYEIFHIVFAMGAMYFAMLFISWELHHPTREWSIDVGWASTWVKFMNEWLAASIYIWRLIARAISRKTSANDEESAPHILVA
ncbi:probable serine incorporator isoform X2 [Brachypodium distachyon]|uniref:probable serine incorporator isoform X2 n=1 Tax=Brachypodium distachyon TaxID=15368 RepID=UPI000D0D02D9|nr:probable serine incorporator isoform X2 [Brachypodium distachyon]|eukprot:XP_024312220.1 probable serine incorporator isoform X2 [Brachypodium distachyon]